VSSSRARRLALLFLFSSLPATLAAQRAEPAPAPRADARVGRIARAASAERMERDVRRLVAFGTRHTLSDTVSATRGIGAARRWVKAQFDSIAAACGGCLEVSFQRTLVAGDTASRVPRDAEVVNVVAVQRGTSLPEHRVAMTAHLDSRASDVMDSTIDAPGADDDASGVAAVLEAARLLSRHRFGKTIVYAALSGEEQGLLGGEALARRARDGGWVVEGVLNNDIVGNVRGMRGETDDRTVRVFSEPVSAAETDADRRRRRSAGGEVDGPSRQLARYVDAIARRHPNGLGVRLIYRLDRFRRGGDHRAFNDLGFAAVRVTEGVEDYTRQHQDVRVEGGVRYGDLPDALDYRYAARVAGLNAASLAALAWAPAPPDSVQLRGGVSPSTTLSWRHPAGGAPHGYWVYWRATDEARWTERRWVGPATGVTLEGVIIDDHLFGVASASAEGSESVVRFAVPGR
jgi:hypothetical protein